MAGDDPIFGPKHDGMQQHAVNGAVSVVLAQAVKLPFQLASLLILPRFLTPTDYGVYAMVQPFLSFALLLHGVGVHQAIIQSPTLNRPQASALFWIATVTGVAGGVIFLACAPLIGAFYKDENGVPNDAATAIAAASALFLIHAGIINTPRALVNRQMKFGWLAVIDAAGIALGLIAGLIAAMNGMHYWALVIDGAVTSLVVFVGIWMVVGWTPKEKPDFRDVWRFFRFGGGLMASDFFSLIARQADSILIGNRQGDRQLGLYDRGNKLALVPMDRINLLFDRLLLPLLSRMVGDGDRYRRAYLRMIRQVMLFLVPGTVAVGVTADVLVPFAIGEQWAEAAPIFAWLTIAALHQPVSMTMTFLFISQQRATALFVWNVFSATTSMAAFYIGLELGGAVGVAAAFALSDILIRMPFLWWIVTRKGPIRMMDVYRAAAPFAMAAIAVFAATHALMRLPYPDPVIVVAFPWRDYASHIHLHDFFLLAASAIGAYAVAVATLTLFSGGRAALADTGKLFSAETRRLLFRRGPQPQV